MRRRVLCIPGPVAENKDWARDQRQRVVLPTLRQGKPVILDFAAVATTTQSFVHACISKAVAELGEDVLDRIDFRGCNDQVREVIEGVIEYSLRARTLTQQGLSASITKKDVPQADSLGLVRDIVDALAGGDTTPADIAMTTGFSYRHVHYRLHAARVLGLAKFVRNLATLTERGVELSRAGSGTRQERGVLERAINESTILRQLAPGLLGARPPDHAKLTLRLETKTGLSTSTARRRARSLLAWRRSVLQEPLLEA